MKKMTIFASFLFCLVLLTSLSSAMLQYQQQRYFENSSSATTTLHAIFFYPKDSIGFEPLLPDYIKNGAPLNFYIQYNSYIETWNTHNPSNRVNWCNLTITQFPSISNNSFVAYSKLLVDDVANTKFFLLLNKGDGASFDVKCNFQGNRTLDMPVDFSLVTPTWECKACQYYSWSEQQAQLNKIETIQGYNIDNTTYILKIIQINYEILLVLVGVLGIALFFFSIGIIFIAIRWVYNIIKGLIK